MPAQSEIGDTPITWVMIQHDFQTAFKTTSKIGPNRSARTIGAGAGFASMIFAVSFDWTENESGRLPNVAALKVTTLSRLRELADQFELESLDAPETIAAFHDTEFKLYSLGRDDPSFADAVKLPTFYCGRAFDADGLNAGYFVYEYVSDFVFRHFYHSVPESATLELISILAKLGAYSLKHPTILTDINNTAFNQGKGDKNQEKIAKYLKIVTERYPERSSQIEVLKFCLPFYKNAESFETALRPFGQLKVSTHGDSWPGNVMWQFDSAGQLHVKHLIDWQLMHCGSPFEDLVLCLVGGANQDTYFATRVALIQQYYNTLANELKDSSIQLPWKNADEFLAEFEKFFPIFAIPMMPQFVIAEEQVMKNDEEFKKEENTKCFREKLFLLLEDSANCVRKHYMNEA